MTDLFDFQTAIVNWAVKRKTAGVFADCGLGKTFIQLKWLEALGGGLIMAPLAVAQQTKYEARKLDLVCTYVRSQKDVTTPGIYVTNYEMAHAFDPAQWGAVVLDESSILKNLDGATRNFLIDQWSRVPYRLCCTATPAPNDITELGNHAEFLGVMPHAQMLGSFFVHDDNGWRLKGHAREKFYEWLASWSIMFQYPSQLGFAADGFKLPALAVETQAVPIDHAAFAEASGRLFVNGLSGIEGRLTARRQSLDARVNQAAKLILESGESWVVWCGLNDEGRLLAKQLPGAALVEGSMDLGEKIRQIGRFLDGTARVLITKVKVAGFGLNLQYCHNVMFLGLSDSYEMYYQAIRRCWRYGQQSPVRVVIMTSDIEGVVVDNVKRKEAEHQVAIDAMVARASYYGAFELNGKVAAPRERESREDTGEGWEARLGDSIQELQRMEECSVDFSVFSPPFMSLFSYSDDERDLGNTKGDEEFRVAYGQIATGLFRVLRQGRLVAVHVAQVAAKKAHDGFIGLKDFRGLVISAMQDAGFDYHGDITIDKNPQAQAVRTHSKALLFKQLEKDASWLRPGLADYLLIFRKPGEPEKAIHPDISRDEWITWAHPVWYGIRESDTLNVLEARTEKDEKHIAPLQLPVIERAIRLWSNPGETVLSPFMGIGSEGYIALKHGRQFVGIELKPEYYEVAKRNLQRALDLRTQQKML